jgi:hypothetical protein
MTNHSRIGDESQRLVQLKTAEPHEFAHQLPSA